MSGEFDGAEGIRKVTESHYGQIVENASEVILVAQDGMVKFINPIGPKIMGYTKEELCSRPFTDFIHPADRAMVLERYTRRLQGAEELQAYSFRLIDKKGEVHWVDINAVLIDWEGRPGSLNFISDVTDRKRAEEALRRSEEWYRTLIATSPDPILIYDLQGNIQFANEQAMRIFGAGSKEEFFDCLKNIGDVLDEKERQSAFENLKRTLENGRSIGTEYCARTKDGTLLRIEVNSSVLREEDGTPRSFISIIRDITPQKRVEEALRVSEERFRSLINNLSDVVVEVDMGTNFIYCSPQVREMFGYEPDELLGRSFMDFIYIEDIEIAIGQLDYFLTRKEVANFEVRVTHRDGSVRHVNTSARLVKDKDGNKSLVGVLRDVTDRILTNKQVEWEKNRAEFYLDLLSHDIGNINQGLLAWTSIARSEGTSREERERALMKLDELEKRSIKLVRNVLLLSRLKDMTPQFSPTDIIPLLLRSVDSVKAMFMDRTMEISLDLPEQPMIVKAEPVIEEVFFNLLHNGVKFQYRDPVVLEISLSVKGQDIILTIMDHGIGIPDEQKPNLFSRHIKGPTNNYTGIGLSLVKELVTRYEGKIEVRDRIEGDPDKGTLFLVTFPATSAE